jgi:altronate dehydratase large subunit
MDKIKGYKRADGKIGIRNHMLVIPSVICAAHVAESIARNVPGAVFIANQYGCGQMGKDFEQTFRTLAGIGRNPNVGAVLVVGLGCELLRPEKLAHEIAESKKPVEMITIQNEGGTSAAIKKGTAIVERLTETLRLLHDESCPVSELILGLECGGSDSTSGLASNPAVGYATDLLIKAGGSAILTETPEMIGAEHILAKRAVNASVAEKLLSVVNAFEQKVFDEGCDIRGTQPCPGNMAGGITTIEEKSLGCAFKAGTNTIQDVIMYGEPVRAQGLTIMDAPGHDVQSMIGMLASGAQVVVFTTGRGNPCGTPIAPVVKVTGNRETYLNMKENTDVYVGDLIHSGSTLEDEGRKVYDTILRVCNGELTASEKFGHREFGIWRIATTI